MDGPVRTLALARKIITMYNTLELSDEAFMMAKVFTPEAGFRRWVTTNNGQPETPMVDADRCDHEECRIRRIHNR